MNSLLKEIITKAETIGWTYEGTNARGHSVLVHKSGARYTTASTPSDRRGVLNTLSDLERIGGQKLEKINHRRSRKTPDNKEEEGWLAASRRRSREKQMRDEEIRMRRARAIAAAEDSVQREKSISNLMRPGWGR